MNRASAMAVLQSRLDQLEITRQAQMNAEHTQSLNEISWGNQIRSYVLHVRFPFFLINNMSYLLLQG
jgi:peptide chain release factor 2